MEPILAGAIGFILGVGSCAMVLFGLEGGLTWSGFRAHLLEQKIDRRKWRAEMEARLQKARKELDESPEPRLGAREYLRRAVPAFAEANRVPSKAEEERA